MFICVCSAVSDDQWNKALSECDNDWIEASNKTGAGLNCGSCRVFLQQSAYSRALPLTVLSLATAC